MTGGTTAQGKAMFVVARTDFFQGWWSPYRGIEKQPSLFDPAEVKYLVGVSGKLIRGVLEVVPDTEGRRWREEQDEKNPQRHRVCFNGVPVMQHLAGTPSPVVWRRGFGVPVQIAPAGILTQDDAPVRVLASEGAQRAVLGDVVVTRGSDGGVAVDAPAGTTVTVRTSRAAAVVPLASGSGQPTGLEEALEPASQGSFFTPQEMVRSLVEFFAAAGEELADPTAGTGGFLLDAFGNLLHSREATGAGLPSTEAARLCRDFLADPVFVQAVAGHLKGQRDD